MTRAQAEAEQRRVERRCRGPLPDDARKVVNALLADGLRAEAAAVDAKHRKGCGFDFNRLLVQVPFDGAAHEVKCPKCGQVIRFTAPAYELDG